MAPETAFRSRSRHLGSANGIGGRSLQFVKGYITNSGVLNVVASASGGSVVTGTGGIRHAVLEQRARDRNPHG